MHDQVSVGQTCVNFFDAGDGKDVAGGLAGEFVGTVAGTDGNGQGIELGATHEIGRLFGVGKQLIKRELAVGAVAVFFVAFHGFKGTQTAQFAFNGNAQFVGHVDDTAGDIDVVVVVGNGFAVFHEGAVHHDAGKAQIDGTLADGRRLAVILVHDHRNMGVGFNRCLDQVFQEAFAGVLAGAGRGLHDHRAVGFSRCFHDRLNLFKIVDVECGNAIAVFGGMVEQLAHGNEGHE